MLPTPKMSAADLYAFDLRGYVSFHHRAPVCLGCLRLNCRALSAPS